MRSSKSMSATEYRSACASIVLMAPVLIRRCSAPRPTASTTTAFRRVRNFCGARPGRSNGMSSKATPMCTWTCAAAAGPAGRSNSSAATSRTISTTSSNGSARSPGRTARSAASASPISACCNGSWARWRRRRSPASPRMTAWPTPTAPAAITAASRAISSPATGGTRTASSTAIPASGPSREQETDLTELSPRIRPMTTSGASAAPGKLLDRIKVPLYSSGVWGKMQLHTRGNIDGYLPRQRAEEAAHVGRAERLGGGGGILQRRIPQATCCCRSTIIISKARAPTIWRGRMSNTAVRGSNLMRSAETWPPPGIRYTRWYLNASRVRQRHLAQRRRPGAAARQWRRPSTTYKYPNPGWVAGVVGFGPSGPPAASIRCGAC